MEISCMVDETSSWQNVVAPTKFRIVIEYDPTFQIPFWVELKTVFFNLFFLTINKLFLFWQKSESFERRHDTR
jgi:hypothetical protein